MVKNKMFALGVAAALLLSCADRDELMTRNNPFDAGGSDFTTNQAPEIVRVALPSDGWYDYDFDDSTGTLMFTLVAEDRNEYYDTLRYLLYAGGAQGSLDLVTAGIDTLLPLPGVQESQRWFYRLAATDMTDTTDTAGTVTAPSVPPPHGPATVSAHDFSTGVRLSWSTHSGASGYRVYRADSAGGSYTKLLDTLGQGSSGGSEIRWFDSLDDYGVHVYRVAAYSQHGQCFGEDTVWGRRYYGGLPAPTISYVSQGAYESYIRIAWYGVSSSYKVKRYLVYRAESSTGPYREIGGTAHTGSTTHYYYDSVPTTDTYYYRLAAVDNEGRGSRLSEVDYGYRIRVSAPPYLSASDGRYETHIYVSWSPVSGASGYYVYRRDSDSTEYVKIDSTRNTHYYDTVPTTDTYFYRATAYGSSGEESSPSTANAGYRRRLSAPYTVLASDSAYATHVRITWTGVSAAAGYYVYRADSITASTYELIDSTTETAYNDSSVGAGIHYYKVAAYGAGGLVGTLSNANAGSRKLLPAPASLTASDGDHQSYVEVRWDAVVGAEGYEVRRSPVDTPTSETVLDSTTDTVYVDSSALEEVAYLYRVTAFDERGTGAASEPKQGRLMYTPNAPQVSSRMGYLVVTWDSVSYARGYHVYRSTVRASGFERIAETTAGTRTLNDTVADYGLYYYRLAAYNDNGTSSKSAPDSAGRLPGVPGVTVAEGIDHIRLTWNAVQGAARYEIYRSPTDPLSYTVVDTTTDTFYVDSLSTDDRYYYRVKAWSACAAGDFSSRAEAGRAQRPCTPLGLAAYKEGDNVRLTWGLGSSCSPVEHYYIYRGPSTDSLALIDSTATTVYRDSITSGDTLYYQVSGVNALGEGGKAGPQAGWLSPPLAPSELVIGDGEYGTHIPLSWPAVGGADGYLIYRSVGDQSSYSIHDTTTDTFYLDSAVEGAEANYYRLKSYSELLGASRIYGPSAGGHLLLPPAEVQAADGRAHIEVTWTASRKAAGYVVYRATTPDGSLEPVDSTTGTSYRDTVENAAPYYYRVSAYNKGETEPSEASEAARRLLPDVPAAVRASEGGYADSVRVWWSGSEGADGYRLYRDTDSSFGSPEPAGETADTAFCDTTAGESVYYYRVKAFNAIGESVLSSPAAVGYRSPGSAPGVPVSVAAGDTIDTHILVTWERPADGVPVSGYAVYRADAQDGEYAAVDSTAVTRYEDYVPLTFPTTYWYKVRAYNAAGESALSSAAEGSRNR